MPLTESKFIMHNATIKNITFVFIDIGDEQASYSQRWDVSKALDIIRSFSNINKLLYQSIIGDFPSKFWDPRNILKLEAILRKGKIHIIVGNDYSIIFKLLKAVDEYNSKFSSGCL